MDPGHYWLLAGLLAVAIGVPVVGFVVMMRILRKDEAIEGWK